MASTAAERQKERHKRMIELGFKKRGFYISEQTLQKLNEHKLANNLDGLDEALRDLIDKSK